MDNLWIVVNIGCIECGVSSNIVGVFDSEEEASKVINYCYDNFDWREGGQNAFEAYRMPEINKIADEYSFENRNPKND